MRWLRRLALVGTAALLAVGAAAAYRFAAKLLASAETAEQLCGRELERAERYAAQELAPAGPAAASETFLAERRRRVVAELRDSGAADPAAILREASRSAAQPAGGSGAYIVPAYVKRAWVGGRPVWLLVFGWGLKSGPVPGRPEPPRHVRIVVVDAAPPYRTLASMSCG